MMKLRCYQGCHVHSGPNERLSMERACAKSLTLDSNRSVSIEFDRFDVVFPYDYNFAACLEEARIMSYSTKMFVLNFFMKCIFSFILLSIDCVSLVNDFTVI